MARAIRKKAAKAKQTGRFKSRGVKAPKATWRAKYQAAQTKFDDVAKQVYLDTLAKTGHKGHSALSAGVTMKTVNRHREDDAEFDEAADEALAAWSWTVAQAAQKVGIRGVEEIIASGGKVVGKKRVWATNILAMEMRRVDPAYKDRAEVDLNVKGGVLVAPSGLSQDEWSAQFGKAAPVGGAS